jgi:O-antigen/teichoic acid export membrane protein
MNIIRAMKKLFPGDGAAQTGILWNIGSFAVIGVGGIAANIIIAYVYSADVLGVFNQVMSFYIVLGQVGAMGMQKAAVYFVPRQKNKEELGALFSSFFCVVTLVAALASVLLYVAAVPLGTYVYKSPELMIGLRYVAPAILLFSLNKLLLGFVNGMRFMKAFAIMQGMRYVLIILFLLGMAWLKAPSKYVALAFTFAEIGIFLPSLFFIFRHISLQKPRREKMKDGFHFGGKSVAGGVIGDLNTKVDIFVLGIFSSDRIVGIYSFAALLAEGFFVLIVVFRNNMNPLFARLIMQKNYGELRVLQKDIARKVLPLSAAGAVLIMIGFWVLCFIMPGQAYIEALIPLGVILACMAVASPYVVSGNLLTHQGRPGLDSFITILTVVVNALCNVLLIPLWGMMGAAVATGFSYLCFSSMTKMAIKKYVPGE